MFFSLKTKILIKKKYFMSDHGFGLESQLCLCVEKQRNSRDLPCKKYELNLYIYSGLWIQDQR